MTDNKNSNEYIDKNLDMLLELGEPIPSMPEDLKNQIRSRLVQIAPEPDKKSILTFRWAVLPLAAAAALVFFLLVPWKGDLNGSISWADVQKQLEQVRSVSSKLCGQIEATTGQKMDFCASTYRKDPGLMRGDIQVSVAEGMGVKPGATITAIAKQESGRLDFMLLDNEAHQGQLQTWLFNADDMREPPFQSLINSTAKAWEILKKISEDETKTIGERIINGIPAVGFSIDAFGPKRINFPDNSTVIESTLTSGEVWVTSSDGTPIMLECEVIHKLNSNYTAKEKYKYTDIQWNVPLEDGLFNLDVPEGWHLNRTQIETIDYEDNKLAPGITLEIYASDQEPMITAEDVVGITQAIQTSYPGSNRQNETKITIELKPEAAQQLHHYADIHPGKFIRLNFNDEVYVALELDRNHQDRIDFDLSWLNLSLSEIEERYFTETSRISEKDEQRLL